MTNPAVQLHPFMTEHVTLLAEWLRRAHVARWYPAPLDNIAWALNPPSGADQAVIVFESREVGYIRWQRVDRETLDSVGLFEVPAGSVDIDLLIGEPGLVGRGIGPAALAALSQRLCADPQIPLLGLTTSVANLNARQAFEKVGFRIARQYQPPGFGPCHLLVLQIKGGSAGASGEKPG